MSGRSSWTTAIAEVREDDVVVRGYALSDLIGQVTYADSIFLVLNGELPTTAQSAMLDAILVSLIEHGISPSTIITRTLTSCGTPVQAALAGGALSIADWHGGAGEALGEELAAGVTVSAAVDDKAVDPALRRYASEMIARYRAQNLRFQGFGHPQHVSGDPRATKLFRLADELGVSGRHTKLARILEEEIERELGRSLPMNVNGAVGALLLDLGFRVGAIRGLVIGARMTGLVAHVMEELDQGNRWRHATHDEINYVGAQRREFPAKA